MKRIARLQALWASLNAEHFAGQLSPVPIRVTRSRHTYGYFNGPAANGGSSSIRISTVLADTPALLRDTMAHEMIHQALYQWGYEDWDSHGEGFNRQHIRIFGVAYVEPT